MERVAKRQRLHSPISHEFPHSFDNQHYYDIPHREPEQSERRDEAQSLEEDADTLAQDPDVELERKRAQAEYKLKSAFEAIFEKYGKDFDGIADEIDLATGNIVVNNGHLVEMRDEQDAGDIGTDPQDLEDDTTGLDEGDDFVDEVDNEESDEDEESNGGEGIIEDDLILRGFTQATQFLHTEPYRPTPQVPSQRRENVSHMATPSPSSHTKTLPSRSDILTQFGPELGSQIAQYVAQQKVNNDSHIEPAWRVPDIPTAPASGSSMPITTMTGPETCQPPSPGTGRSLWGPGPPRKRRRAKRSGNDAKLPASNGGTDHTLPHSRSLDSPVSRPIVSVGEHAHAPTPGSIRTRFTPADDRLLIDCVRRALNNNIAIMQSFWEDVGAKYPHHSWKSWRWRYSKKNLAYFASSPARRPETTTSIMPRRTRETSNSVKPNLSSLEAIAYQSVAKAGYQHPRRARKPHQKDSNIVAWSEAVNSIKSSDPELHRGILQDIGRNGSDEGGSAIDQPLTSANQDVSDSRLSPQVPLLDRTTCSQHDNARVLSPSSRSSGSAYDTEDRSEQSPHSDRLNGLDGDANQAVRATESRTLQGVHSGGPPQIPGPLVETHDTKPFLCMEPDCAHVDERGFFTQSDLVEHVKLSHPTNEALHRLRGRVDSYLLRQRGEFKPLFMPHVEITDGDGPVVKQKDTDSISLARVNNTYPSSPKGRFSPGSDHVGSLDLPGMSGTTIPTPITDVPSLAASHTSNIITRPANTATIQEATTPHTLSENQQESLDIDGLIADEFGIGQVPSPSPSPEEHTGTENTEEMEVHGPLPKDMVSSPPGQRSTARPKTSLPSSIPNSQSSAGDELPSSISRSSRRWRGTPDDPIRNDIARSGDTRDHASPSKISTPSILPPRIVHPILTPQNVNTPAGKRPRKPVTPINYDSEEMDELSLASDGFVLLSSRPRTTKTPLDASLPIKPEDSPVPSRTMSGTPSRKRRLDLIEGSDEVDELMGDEPEFSLSITRPVARSRPQVRDEPAEPSMGRSFSKRSKLKFKSTLQNDWEPSNKDMSPSERRPPKDRSSRGNGTRVQARLLGSSPTGHTDREPNVRDEIADSEPDSSMVLSSSARAIGFQ